MKEIRLACTFRMIQGEQVVRKFPIFDESSVAAGKTHDIQLLHV